MTTGRTFVLVGMVAMASLAGCSSAASHPAAAGLCGPSHGNAQRMIMTRTNLPGRLHRGFSFGPVQKATSPPTVKSVAEAFCSLPMLPANTSIGCGGGVSYSMQFYSADTRVATVRFQATGCQEVDGLIGKQSRVYTSQSPIWSSLGQAIGMPDATLATFAGRRQPG